MKIFPDANEARNNIFNDLVVYDEIRTIERSILNARNSLQYETTVVDETTMTENTVTTWFNFTVDIDSDIVICQDHGLVNYNLVQVDSTNQLPNPLSYAYNYYTIVINENQIRLATKKEKAINNEYIDILDQGLGIHRLRYFTTSRLYYQVWQGLIKDRALQIQMDQVEKYFKDLNYSIVRKTNTSTNNTFYWEIKW